MISPNILRVFSNLLSHVPAFWLVFVDVFVWLLSANRLPCHFLFCRLVTIRSGTRTKDILPFPLTKGNTQWHKKGQNVQTEVLQMISDLKITMPWVFFLVSFRKYVGIFETIWISRLCGRFLDCHFLAVKDNSNIELK